MKIKSLARGSLATGFVMAALLSNAAIAQTESGMAEQYATPEFFSESTGMSVTGYSEAPELAEMVAAGKLPPLAERLPKNPAVIVPADSIGKYGGAMVSPATVPNSRGWDTLLMRLETLFKFDTDLRTVVPNVAESFSLSDDGKVLTITLREGMKWSDGTPLTVDDVEYFYQRILTNPDVTPSPDRRWFAGGELVKFNRVDNYTFQWEFAAPNPSFVMKLANAAVLSGLVPKHYIGQFDIAINPDADKLAEEAGFESWVTNLQNQMLVYGNYWYFDGDLVPGQPTIGTHVFSSVDSAGNKTFTRNPYFFKVDSEGNQLPYVDDLKRLLVTNLEAQDLGGIAGRYTHYGWGSLANYTTYKKNEDVGGYETKLVTYYRGNEFVFSFNVNHPEPIKREVFGDLRFRQAMSVAIDRERINKLVYFGRATARQAAPVPQDPYYEDWMGEHYAQFDRDLANKLLDEMGLTERDSDGYRLGPDGEPFTVQMVQAPPEPAWAKIVELVTEDWNAVGVRTRAKLVEFGLFQQQRNAGQLDVPAWAYSVHLAGMWSGAAANMSQYAPHYGYGALEWAAWLDSNGETGTEPPLEVQTAAEDFQKFLQVTPDDPAFDEAAKAVFTAQLEGMYAIGTVGLPPQPLLISKQARNGPKDGDVWDSVFHQWTQFLPEQFWFDTEASQ
ncbi:ABC transporter substrate-binding protein [Marinovum sp. 2_MG-2023]|uniref:ABC transporter substrate-binding protein n=1 Tax=unclassified Marinovum TaxID=2647166 RepID=UPI0026E3DBAC|nr:MULTISPECIES: ABC transporter substrate-binding protein [unclassified Marinovum]MDO6728964.1 ABC transporter substrate-binding protein [Marinovum sp. 2_MG-2023]MDO6779409.1 ABC transporter substrate-binding protein [Marinovum sp. 1_MG-2023]